MFLYCTQGCNDGYYIDPTTENCLKWDCVEGEGPYCKKCLPLEKRTFFHQCLECNTDYIQLDNKTCQAIPTAVSFFTSQMYILGIEIVFHF